LCALYQSAPKLKEEGVHLVSCDEKTGMQAIERMATPMKQGQVERIETNYTRHGTQCLIANFEVATGKIISPTIGDTRKEEDFATHIKKTVATAPDEKWIFIVDQLNTHKSSTLVEYVSKAGGYADILGEKGKSGILKDMESRAKFLSDESHRIQFVYTPKHASWLNQVEVWFSILSRKLLKRLSSGSTDELKNKVLRFIDYFNLTAAKVFKWTYNGRPLAK
jgi:DDE superfamily endonuclease